LKHLLQIIYYVSILFFIDKNFNLRSPSVNVVVPSVRKHLTTPSKATPQNRRLNPGTHFKNISFFKNI